MSMIIQYPLVTEKAMDAMDFENKLQFIVHIDATKPEVKAAVTAVRGHSREGEHADHPAWAEEGDRAAGGGR